MPPSRPISPTEQLNLLSWINNEESSHIPEPKKEEIEVITFFLFFSSLFLILFSSSDIGIISPKVYNLV